MSAKVKICCHICKDTNEKQEHGMQVPMLGCGCCKRGISLKKKMHCELSPLIKMIAICIVNTNSKFQINILSNKRDITKCQHIFQVSNTYSQ